MQTADALAARIRLESVEAVNEANFGFLGSCLSIADIMAVLAIEFELTSETGDWLILSKGHAAPALYAALGLTGFDTYAAVGSSLQGHPATLFCAGARITTGSLGLGVAAAVGVAFAFKQQRSNQRVIVILGDGEVQAGTTWEALQAAATNKLDNLVLIVDCNGYQSTRPTPLPVVGILTCLFGSVTEVDGHDTRHLASVLRSPDQDEGAQVVIANTVRGRGIEWLEQRPLPMSAIPPQDVLSAAISSFRRLATGFEAQEPT